MSSIREPAVTGSFYPAGKQALQNELKDMLGNVKASAEYSDIFGIIAPHGGIRERNG